jgi:hypothetical protein
MTKNYWSLASHQGEEGEIGFMMKVRTQLGYLSKGFISITVRGGAP